jgi:conjugal transfer mating pair stabilization protein TraG
LNFTIYSYWNITELTGVFNAISALVYSDNYGGALQFIALVGVLSVAMTVLVSRGQMLDEFWKWTVMVALLNGMLLAPRATVQIVDVTGTNPPAVVSNVPEGLAAVAGSVSTIGYWLTTSYETVFALPGSLTFETGGMMFGQKVQQEITKLKPATIAWSNDFNSYYTECVSPNILSGTLTYDQLNTTNDIWGLLGTAALLNPGFYVTLSTLGTVTCPVAYTDLDNRLTASEVPATLKNYAVTALPQSSTSTLAVNQVSQVVVDSSSYFNGIATAANTAVQQAIVSNSIIDAHCNMLSQTTNTALANECMTQSEGFRQTNTAYMAMANIAQSSMPKLHNAIELIQYGVFPIILIFIIVAGHKGMSILKTYVMSLVWIQLWPPLYAVVNYMMNVHASYWVNATQGNAMALQMQQWISQTSVSDQAIAGMLTIAIPGIAAALVKGGDVGMQAVGNLASPPASVEKLASQMAMGNHSSGQINESPNATTGAGISKVISHDGSVTSTFANGGHSFKQGDSAFDSVAKIESGASYGSKLETSSADAVKSSNTNSQQSTAAMQSVLGNIQTLAQTSGKGDVAATADNSTHMATITKANQVIEQSTKTLMEKTGVTQAEATEIVAAATAGTPGAGLVGSGASVTLSGKETASRQKIAEEANAIVKTNQLSTLVSDAKNAAHALTFTHQNSTGAEASRNVQAGLTTSQNFQNTAKSDLARSQELAHKAAIARSLDVGSKNDITQQVFDKVINQAKNGGITIDGHKYGSELNYEKINAELRRGNQDMSATLDKTAEGMYEERIKGMVNNGKNPEGRTMLTDKDVVQNNDANNAAQPGIVAVGEHYAGALGSEKQSELNAGVNPDQKLVNTVAPVVAKTLTDAGKQTAGSPAVETAASQHKKNEAFAADVKQRQDISLSGAVLENSTNAVLGDGSSYLLNKVIPGQPSGAFFNKGADDFDKSFAPGTSEATKAIWATGETVVVGATALVGGGVGGKAAKSVAELGVESLASKAAENATAKVAADATLETAQQGVAGAEANVAARQTEEQAAQAKYDATSGARWPLSDTGAQQQFIQDREALATARTNATEANNGLADANLSMGTAQTAAMDGANAAADSKILADSARRGVADQITTGQVFGATGGVAVGNEMDSLIDSNLKGLLGVGKSPVAPGTSNTDSGQDSKTGDIPPPRS